jgi:RimJ/RimL family protein N-acetyltransferase
LLRSAKWDDLQNLLLFANALVDEREIDPDLGIILDKHPEPEKEAEWLGRKLAAIESGQEISVVAEADGVLVGNSEVTRGTSSDEFLHGKLGISVKREFRDSGIGFEMMKTLIDESRNAGLKTIELEVFANNPRATHVYEKGGFKQVGRIPKKIYRQGRFIDIVVMAIEL